MSSPRDHRPKNAHPDMRGDAPGRIPESLIDAALDGELNEDIQREIAHALKYDSIRKQELLDTTDAINALQMPITTPDFSNVVLARADRNRRYIPASWRRHVRVGRVGVAAALLMTLMGVAGLQRVYPRLTTLGAHPTPVLDIEQAVGHDAQAFAQKVDDEVRTLRSSFAPMVEFLSMPGRTDHAFAVELSSVSSSGAISGSFPRSSNQSFSGTLHPVGFRTSVYGASAVFVLSESSYFSSEAGNSSWHAGSSKMARVAGVSGMCSWGSPTDGSTARLVHESTPRLPETQSDSDSLDVPALP